MAVEQIIGIQMIGICSVVLLSVLNSGIDERVFLDGFETLAPACPSDTSGLTRAYYGETFESVFTPFGQPAGPIYFGLAENEYASLPLTVPVDPGVHKLLWDEILNSPNSIRISVDSCTGPPSKESPRPDADCFYQVSGRNGGITMTSEIMLSGTCDVEPGEIYWLNVSFQDEFGNDSCACTVPMCSCEILTLHQ